MKFVLRYPLEVDGDPRLQDAESVAAVARAAEAAGFEAIAFSEHPAPSQKWLDAGGHDAFDPLTALAYVAGVTTTLRLMTYLLVLPYRNPLLAASQVATVDRLSGGRLSLTLGTGYLRSEFAALGVDFTERNALFDEALDVMVQAWSTAGLSYEGRHFTALGQTVSPRVVQQPHPPLLIGGNSRVARERVAASAQGWSPLLVSGERSATTRTPPLATPADVGRAVVELKELVAGRGRDVAGLVVQVEWKDLMDLTPGAGRILDGVGELAAAGTTHVIFEPAGHSVAGAHDAVARYGAEVIATTDR